MSPFGKKKIPRGCFDASQDAYRESDCSSPGEVTYDDRLDTYDALGGICRYWFRRKDDLSDNAFLSDCVLFG